MEKSKLRAWPEVQELVGPLATHTKQALKQSLDTYGVIQGKAVLHLPDGRIIDGYNRWQLTGGNIETVELNLPEETAFGLALALQIGRRNLSNEQLSGLQVNLRQNKENQKATYMALRQAGHTQESAAAVVGVGQSMGSKWEDTTIMNIHNSCIPDARVIIPAKEHEVIYERLQQGETQSQVAADYQVTQQAICKIKKKIEKAQEQRRKRKEAAHQGERMELDEGIRVIHADFREWSSNLPDNSVALIFTDPPYGEEYISLYGDLAEIATRVLVPGGSLITYVGHYALPDVLSLMVPHLRFWWTMAVHHSGGSARLPGKWVFVEWKPLLWFVKGGRRDNRYVADMIKSDVPLKDLHDWQQGMSEASYYIERLTNEGELIFDPFCGSGTTLIASKRLGRRSVGTEIDGSKANQAKKRIHEHFDQ